MNILKLLKIQIVMKIFKNKKIIKKKIIQTILKIN